VAADTKNDIKLVSGIGSEKQWRNIEMERGVGMTTARKPLKKKHRRPVWKEGKLEYFIPLVGSYDGREKEKLSLLVLSELILGLVLGSLLKVI